MALTADERRRIDECAAAFEARTGAQVVAAVVGKSDHYPEIPWKAFALGAALGALVRWALDVVHPDWTTGHGTLFDAVMILGTGAAAALLTVRFHAFARLFLHRTRAEGEVLQHAQALFLRREAFATARRNGVLVMVSLFERQVVILPGTGLRAAAGTAALQPIVARMTPLLAAGAVGEALCTGIAELEALLAASGLHATGNAGGGLPDVLIEEGGSDARA